MSSGNDRQGQETERPQEGKSRWRELGYDLNFMCKHFLTHNEVGPWSSVAYDGWWRGGACQFIALGSSVMKRCLDTSEDLCEQVALYEIWIH